MEVRVDRLREVLDLLGPVVPKKTSLPVLSNVMLRDGQAEAMDPAVAAVAVEFPEVVEPCLLPYRPVRDLLKRVPGNEVLTIEVRGKVVELTWSGGRSSYDTATQDPADYLPFPKVDAETEVTVDGDSLVPALCTVAHYCATEDSRPILNGVALESLGEALEIGAGDGFRMAYHTLPISFPEAKMVIPGAAVWILEALWKKTPRIAQPSSSLIATITAKRQLELTFNKAMLRARFWPVTMVAHLIDGTAPTFRNLIPEESPSRVRVLAPDFDRAVLRVAGVAKDGKDIVRLVWADGVMMLSATTDERESETTIHVDTEGEPGKTAVNVGYLLNYLRDKEGMVTMGIKGPQSPILFQHSTPPLVVMMPMFVQW